MYHQHRSQFSYCLVIWIISFKSLMSRIDTIHKNVFKSIFKVYSSNFDHLDVAKYLVINNDRINSHIHVFF